LKKLFIYISVLFLSFNCNRVAVFRAIVLCIYSPFFVVSDAGCVVLGRAFNHC
jgi:hypothetical protein